MKTLKPPEESTVSRQGQYEPGVFDLVARIVSGRVQFVMDGAHPKPPKEQDYREVMRVRLTPAQIKIPLSTYYTKMSKELAALQAAEDKRNGITRKTP